MSLSIGVDAVSIVTFGLSFRKSQSHAVHRVIMSVAVALFQDRAAEGKDPLSVMLYRKAPARFLKSASLEGPRAL